MKTDPMDPARLRCFACARLSATELEHVGHRCNRARVWLLLQWRRVKVRLGLWSWWPS